MSGLAVSRRLAGWALAHLLHGFRLRAPGRAAALGLLVTGMAYAENHYQRDGWPPAAVPQADFYRTVVQNLPDAELRRQVSQLAELDERLLGAASPFMPCLGNAR